MRTVELVEQFRGTLVAPFDIAGDEATHPLVPHVAAFANASRKGIPRTAHTGEGGAASMRETLGRLAPA